MYLVLQVDEYDELNRCYVEAQRIADLLKLEVRFVFEGQTCAVTPGEEY